ncbi:MAG: SIS domain-containing protein [Ruminococcaceae bacterium]|nr:SIS domain-containing protein [Oscillospiraceae bacterium]
MSNMKELIERYPQLNICKKDIENALSLMIDTYKKGGKILVCGNGGSSADADHIVGELMKGFLKTRKVTDERIPQELREKLQGALPAISLSAHASLMTATINDNDADMVFAQQVYGYAKDNDLLIAISTSGNSKNVVNAVKVAKSLGIKTIALTGETGGELKQFADVTICAPSTETYKIQEYHLPIYHYLCAKVEEEFFE